VIPAGTIGNGIIAHEDWVPTIMSMLGERNITQKLLTGDPIGNRTYKVHLDGYDQTAYLSGKGDSARHQFLYWTDDGNLACLRYDQWKLVFMVQEHVGLDVWRQPLVSLRSPLVFNLRSIHLNSQTAYRGTTTHGMSSTRLWGFPEPHSSVDGFRRSKNIRPGKNPIRSISVR
jgi:arylsulfatase A-like enzyme